MNDKYPIISFIVENKKINLAIIGSAFAILTVIVFLIMPLQYTSQISVLPSAATFTTGLAGSLGSLSKFAGIDFSSKTAQSQEMYKGIIYSRRLLEPVIFHEYRFLHQDDSITTNLIQFLEIEDETERERREKVMKRMHEDVIAVGIDSENDILYLSVTTESPFLSALVANRIVMVLNEIVKMEVQKEFHQKKMYLENRLIEIGDSLKIAESVLENFLEEHADPTLPSFQIEHLRLQREVRIQTELFVEFRKQLEIFIADNMINLADIKILDDAYPPFRKSRPKRLLLLMSFVIIFGIIQLGVNTTVLFLRKIKTDIGNSSIEV